MTKSLLGILPLGISLLVGCGQDPPHSSTENAAGSGAEAGSGGKGSTTETGGSATRGGNTGKGGMTGTGGSIGTSTVSCKAPAAAQAPSGVTPLRAIEGFVTRDGSSLSLCGEPFQVVGANVYYVQSYACYGQSGVKQVTDAFDDMVRMSLPVARMWAFNDGASGGDSAIIQTAPGTYVESALVGLDTAIAEAKKRGIRIILTLTNYWTGYGGLPQYATWAGASGPNDFYSNATMQKYFKDYATMLSQRTNTLTGIPYVDEPAILAWEIANELRCEECPVDDMLSTIDSLSTFLKSIFPKHLIADGGEGMDDRSDSYDPMSNDFVIRGDAGASYSRMVDLPGIDMASYHYYPVDWGLTSVDTDTTAWINGHQAIAKAAGKVAYLGEFGYKKGATDTEKAAIYDQWLETFYSSDNDGALTLFWQLVPVSRGADDGYAIIMGRDTRSIATIEKYSAPRALR